MHCRVSQSPSQHYGLVYAAAVCLQGLSSSWESFCTHTVVVVSGDMLSQVEFTKLS